MAQPARLTSTQTGVRLPTDEQIRALHERYAPSAAALELVYTHCVIVCRIVEQLLATVPPGIDVDLVRAGSLLHDIGVYRLYGLDGHLDEATYVRHGVVGHELLSGLGWPERLCRFCSRHTGVGLSRDDVRAQRLSLPVDDYLAASDAERLVMYADKFHSKTSPPVFLTTASCTATLARYGPDKAIRFAALVGQFGEPDLAPLVEEYGHPLV